MSELGITTTVVANYIVAFFIGGLVPTLLYELISRFLFRFSQARVGGSVDTLMFALRLFYIAANVVIFLIKLVYLWYPARAYIRRYRHRFRHYDDRLCRIFVLCAAACAQRAHRAHAVPVRRKLHHRVRRTGAHCPDAGGAVR